MHSDLFFRPVDRSLQQFKAWWLSQCHPQYLPGTVATQLWLKEQDWMTLWVLYWIITDKNLNFPKPPYGTQ
jgi:hypothetical protein